MYELLQLNGNKHTRKQGKIKDVKTTTQTFCRLTSYTIRLFIRFLEPAFMFERWFEDFGCVNISGSLVPALAFNRL